MGVKNEGQAVKGEGWRGTNNKEGKARKVGRQGHGVKAADREVCS